MNTTMHVIADLQLHSRFSRAVSKQMTLPYLALWAKRKGIGLIATGDWTHPVWLREIERDLEEMGNGLLRIKNLTNTPVRPINGGNETQELRDPLFLLATEVSCIYKQGNKVRRVHTLLWVPSLESARKINQEMTKGGCNLMSDGRPIVGLTSMQIAELVLSIEPNAIIIPAHAWTPWFSVYGSLGGFDSIDEAFGPYAKHIYAVETGLSSNPAMNWRIKELDSRAIVSFSDAHSGPKLGREATVFETSSQFSDFSYQHIYEAVSHQSSALRNAKAKIAYTIEFFPEEGKYHWNGHRSCNVIQTPEETKEKGAMCPVCGRPLTVGVMHRVGDLAGRTEEELELTNLQSDTLTKAKMIGSKAFPNRPPFVMLVPLQEIIAEAIGSPVTSPKVQRLYMHLIANSGSEFSLLLNKSSEDISKVGGSTIAEGINRVRQGNIHIDPGYDGVFGTVKIWKEGEKLIDNSKEQLSIF